MRISKLSRKNGSRMGDTATMEATDQFGVRQLDDGVEFCVHCPQAGTVQIAGDFNNWQPQRGPMRNFGQGVWKIKLPLRAGSYRYRLVIDGRWQQDPHNTKTEPNPYGELNSVVQVS